MSPKEIEEINQARKVVGLPPLRPGPTVCLRCLRTFESWDVANNRICRPCSQLSDANDVTTVDVSDLCSDVEVTDSLAEIELWRCNPRSRHRKEIYRQGKQIVDLDEDHLHLFDPDHENDYINDDDEEGECLA